MLLGEVLRLSEAANSNTDEIGPFWMNRFSFMVCCR